MIEIIKALNEMSLGGAIAVIGSIIGGITVILTWLGSQLREHRSASQERRHLDDRIDGVADDMQDLSREVARLGHDLRRLDEQLQKLTALLIEYLSNTKR